MIDADPMKAHDAQVKLRQIIKDGVVFFGDHALQRMRERKLSRLDALNILRRGRCGEAEMQNGAWRYPVRTPSMTFIIEFEAEDELIVVTGWRSER